MHDQPLTESELNLIREEENNLARFKMNYISRHSSGLRDDILKEITDLNESIPEVNSDDLPQVRAQLNRLDAILRLIEDDANDQLDPRNPYFGHMLLKDTSGDKNLYLGNQVFRTADGSIQIIDWKTSPIGMIYFLYEEGDEYEEEIEGRTFEGELAFKRILRIVDGQLQEIQTSDSILQRSSDNSWIRKPFRKQLLKGGAGTASRPENTVAVHPTLGINKDSPVQTSKLLPEITALIDAEQFDLITQPESGVVAIQGLAGSGKTTVALHRVAWLHFQDRQRFAAEKLLIIVFNKALSNYISQVLPSLGVENVLIETYENWIGPLRQRIFSGHLPKGYTESTPVSVIRFKKHPALLELMNEFIASKTREFDKGIEELFEDRSQYKRLLADIKGSPLITQLYTFHEWMEGKRLVDNQKVEFDAEIKSQLSRLIQSFIDTDRSRLESLLDLWEEFFTNFSGLKEGFLARSQDLSPSQLDEIINWLKSQYTALHDDEPAGEKDLTEVVDNSGKGRKKESFLDYEDDSILVYLYQKLFKAITTKDRKTLQYNHIMVDEVQDFSPIELGVLANIAKHPLSMTFAGDVNQKIIKTSGFLSWEQTFESLGVQGQKLSALNVGYRSTFEIMEFALSVLGDLAENKEFIATRHGPPVELFQFANEGEMLQSLFMNLIELMTYEPMASVAIICPEPENARHYFEQLKRVDIPKLRLIDDQNFPFTAGIDVTDLKQVKGLEFDYVILLDVDQQYYRNDSYSRLLLHIAASRAAHQLWIMNYRPLTEILA